MKPANHNAPRPGAGRAKPLKVIYRAIEELNRDPANPRLHSKKQIRQIANSIKIFGFNVPILVDRHGNVICGHGRLLAARELGIAEVPTLCLDHLTPAQARAFMIADNRLTEIATWDDQLLGLVRKLSNRLLIELYMGLQPSFHTIYCGSDRYRTDPREIFGGGALS